MSDTMNREVQTSPDPLICVRNLEKRFVTTGGMLGRKKSEVRAVDGIDLTIHRGETLGLVGESGCGKSTLSRMIMRLDQPDGGEVLYRNQNIFKLAGNDKKAYRRSVQMIFQDPYSSLNPRMAAGKIIREPLVIHSVGNPSEREQRVLTLMEKVGLSPEQATRYPHEFSGGQRQRIGIARALALQPELVIADEPVSALDASIQAQILNLLVDLKKDFGLTYLFVSHDLNVIRHMSDRIAVMYLGKIVEMADKHDLYTRPLHPYTRMLLAAMPSCSGTDHKAKKAIRGEADMTSAEGCSFKNRCVYKIAICDQVIPELQKTENGLCACHRTGEI